MLGIPRSFVSFHQNPPQFEEDYTTSRHSYTKVQIGSEMPISNLSDNLLHVGCRVYDIIFFDLKTIKMIQANKCLNQFNKSYTMLLIFSLFLACNPAASIVEEGIQLREQSQYALAVKKFEEVKPQYPESEAEIKLADEEKRSTIIQWADTLVGDGKWQDAASILNNYCLEKELCAKEVFKDKEGDSAYITSLFDNRTDLRSIQAWKETRQYIQMNNPKDKEDLFSYYAWFKLYNVHCMAGNFSDLGGIYSLAINSKNKYPIR